jgi:hypothetical protein
MKWWHFYFFNENLKPILVFNIGIQNNKNPPIQRVPLETINSYEMAKSGQWLT